MSHTLSPKYRLTYGVGVKVYPVEGTYIFVFIDLYIASAFAEVQNGEVWKCEADIADVLVLRGSPERAEDFWEKYNSRTRCIVAVNQSDDFALKSSEEDKQPIFVFSQTHRYTAATRFARSITLLERVETEPLLS